MNEQANANDGAAEPIGTAASPIDAASLPAGAIPATTHEGGRKPTFAPAGLYPGGRRVLWPVAVGTASIVVAGQNLLNQVGGFLQFFARFATKGNPGQLISELKRLDARAIFSVGMGAADLILPMLLLAAGILVWRQNRRAPGLLKAYAIITILLSVGLAIFQANIIPDVAGIAGGGRARTYLTSSLIISSLWRTTTAMIYPIFLLIWFSRAKVKQHVQTWG